MTMRNALLDSARDATDGRQGRNFESQPRIMNKRYAQGVDRGVHVMNEYGLFVCNKLLIGIA
jgi:hypothetical protein